MISLQSQNDQDHPDIHIHIHIHIDAHVDIVLAYIVASISTDAMLSILAVADDNIVQAHVALLNTRWTPSESHSTLDSSPVQFARSVSIPPKHAHVVDDSPHLSCWWLE